MPGAPYSTEARTADAVFARIGPRLDKLDAEIAALRGQVAASNLSQAHVEALASITLAAENIAAAVAGTLARPQQPAPAKAA